MAPLPDFVASRYGRHHLPSLVVVRSQAAAEGSSVSLWHDAALSGIRDSQLPPPAVARALAVMDACVYDPWAAYDQKAVGTLLGGALRRPSSERTLASKEETVSYAAYRALVDVLPVDADSVYRPLMRQLGYNPDNASTGKRGKNGDRKNGDKEKRGHP
jgi:hypothetical protein